jgi:hypothetical protein
VRTLASLAVALVFVAADRPELTSALIWIAAGTGLAIAAWAWSVRRG